MRFRSGRPTTSCGLRSRKKGGPQYKARNPRIFPSRTQHVPQTRAKSSKACAVSSWPAATVAGQHPCWPSELGRLAAVLSEGEAEASTSASWQMRKAERRLGGRHAGSVFAVGTSPYRIRPEAIRRHLRCLLVAAHAARRNWSGPAKARRKTAGAQLRGRLVMLGLGRAGSPQVP